MKKPVVIIGIGEMGGVFARGFLRTGHPVFPVTRDMSLDAAAAETGGNVGELWSQHRELAQAVAAEVIQLQEKLTARSLDRERLTNAMLEAFAGDPEHKSTGRSAPARLQRALQMADTFGLTLPTLAGMKKYLQ